MNKFEKLRFIFEGRKKQLEIAKELATGKEYASVVVKYVRARRAFRKIRGWV